MPEWLTGLLQGLAKEGPAYAILLGAGVMLFPHLANQHKDHLASLDAKQKGELDRIVGVFEKALAAKEDEIGRLGFRKGSNAKDRDSLYRAIKAEQRAEQKKP